MNEEYLVKLYSWIDSQDATFKEDVDVESFKKRMSDENYAKSIYEWIGSKDQTFSDDVPYEMFSENLGFKKKNTLEGDAMGSDSGDGSLGSVNLDTQKALVNDLEKYTKQFDELTSDYRTYKKEIFDTNMQLLKEEKEAGGRTPELLSKRTDLDKKIDTLNQKEQRLNKFKTILSQQKAIVQKEAADYIDKEAGGGSFIGAMYNSLLSGFESIASSAGSTATDLATLIMPNFGMSDDDYNKMKKDGMSDTDILDKARKTTKGDLIPAVREGLKFAKDSSTTEAYIAREGEESIVFEGLTGMAASLPAMLAPKAQRVIGFALMGMEAVDKETENNPAFADVTESEKYLVKVPIAIVAAYLEEKGIRNVVGSNSKILNYITKNVLGKVGKTTTAKTFNELVDKEVSNAIVKFGLRTGASAAGEFETGAMQYAAEVGIKEIYDAAKSIRGEGNDLFKNPETVGEFVSKTLRSGAAEAIGGFAMGSVTNSVRAYGDKKNAKAIGKQFDLVNSFLEDEKLSKAYKASLAIELREGNITKEEYDSTLASINEIENITSKMPKDISPEDRRKAFDLIREKQEVTREIEKLDDAMATPFKTRLQEINQELANIATKKKVDSESRYEIDGEQLSKEDFTKKIQESSADELSGMSIKVDNDQDVMNMVDQKMKPAEQTQQKVSDVLNRPVTVTKLAGSDLETPIQGDLYVDGQQVVIEDAEGNITELGNVEELSDLQTSEVGIDAAISDVSTTPEGNILVGENTYTIQTDLPTTGISYDADNNIEEVSVKDANGKPVMFKGQTAVDIGYQILLSNATSPEQAEFINEQLEQNDEFREATKATEATTDQDTEQPATGNRLRSEPLQDATKISDRITGRTESDKQGPREFAELDEEKSTRIADAYDKMENNPNDPLVKRAYEALVKETLEQYNAMAEAGYTIVIDNDEPYANSSDMINDLRDNKQIRIFSTESGFGDTGINEEQRQDNPMLQDSGLKDVNGNTLLVNDVFRAVHDFFGHAQEGNSFGPKGEEIAWQVHSEMFSDDARRALTTETRGQNSWVNFSGVNAEAFKMRDQARDLRSKAQKELDPAKKRAMLAEAKELVEKAYESMKFAEQKIGLLSDEFVFEKESGVEAEQVVEASKKDIKSYKKPRTLKSVNDKLREKFLDRQARVKNILKGIKSKASGKALNMMVVRAGAEGYANARFKEAKKKIYGKLNSKEQEELDGLIYARRIIAIVEDKGRYVSYDGYNIQDARRDLAKWESKWGEKKFADMNNRADTYFDEFKKSWKRKREAGLISEKDYQDKKDVDYSPIKTIRYMMSNSDSAIELSNKANQSGIMSNDKKSLTEKNTMSIVTDSQWLLMNNISSTEAQIFKNRMLVSFHEAIQSATKEELESIKEYVLPNKIIGRKKDGSPKYFYDEYNLPGDGNFQKVTFVVDGNEGSIVIDKQYADKLLDVKSKGGVADFIGNITFVNVLRFFATGGNPVFIVGNTLLDFQNILFVGDTYSSFKLLGGIELGYDYTKNFLKKFSGTDSFKKKYMEYMKYGGAMDYLSRDRLRAVEELKPTSKITKPVLDMLKIYARGASYLGELSEISFRMAVYEKELSKLSKKFKKENGSEPTGQSLDDIKFEATRLARETIDFSQGGTAVKEADKMLPYLNAATQGFRRGVDYARSNPKGFAVNMLQYGVMTSSMAAFSLALLMKRLKDDDEEEKIVDILNSVSEYEKANYHIIFTGNKDENGEYEYHRGKKFPLFGGLATTAEQMVYKFLLSSKGIKYDVDEKAILNSFSAGLPIAIDFNEGMSEAAFSLVSRNPALSALIAMRANYDTFTKDQIFKDPNNKQLKESAKGLMDDRINQVYKDLGVAFNASPAKLKVAFEKIFTSPSTNPTTTLFHSAYEGLFSDKNLEKEFETVRGGFLENSLKKIKRSTNSKILQYNEMEKNQKVIEEFDTDIYLRETKAYNDVRNAIKSEEGLDHKKLVEIVKSNFEDENTHLNYYKKYMKFSMNTDVDRTTLDIIYEQNPAKQALLIKLKYGDNLDEQEKSDLSKALNIAGRKINKKTWFYYGKK